MRVAFVHPRYPSAEGTGATHSATQVVTGLADVGHDVRVYCARSPEGAPDRAGLEYRHLAGHSRHPHTDTRLNRELLARRDELREFDILHSYLTPLIPAVADIGRDTDVGTVVTLNAYRGTCAKNDLLYLDREQCRSKSTRKCLHCLTRTGLSGGEQGRLYQTASRLFSLRLVDRGEARLEHVDAFRAPSAHVKSNYVTMGYPDDPIHVIPHPLDDRFDVDHTSEFAEPYRLLYVGSLKHHKGVEKLVPLVAELAESDKAFSLTVVGSGELESTMREQATDHGVTDRVDFRGFVPYEELPSIYAAHDCFVYPGIWEEPLARVYLEALATGTPVVTSEYGSIAEIVGEAGGLTDGSVGGFRDTLLEVAASGALPEMSAAAAGQVEQFRLDRVLDRLKKVYTDIADDATQGSTESTSRR